MPDSVLVVVRLAGRTNARGRRLLDSWEALLVADQTERRALIRIPKQVSNVPRADP